MIERRNESISQGPRSNSRHSGSREMTLIVSGASGMCLAARFAAVVVHTLDIDALHLVVTQGATAVLTHELGGEWASARGFRQKLDVSNEARKKIIPWANTNLGSPIASGSHRIAATVVLPCSAGMAGAISHGISRGLAQRAADVAIKEKRPLVLGVRETPMSTILLENLLRLARAGAHIVPPLPAFYLKPDETAAMRLFIEHYCMRVLDLVGLQTESRNLRWNG